MSNLLSVDEISQILRPHTNRLAQSVWPTWQRYEAIPIADRLTYDLGAEAKILNRYIIHNIKREFAGVPGVHFSEQCGFFWESKALALVLTGPWHVDSKAE